MISKINKNSFEGLLLLTAISKIHSFTNQTNIPELLTPDDVLQDLISSTAELNFVNSPFQERAKEWVEVCFPKDVWEDKSERAHRFLEESLELIQAIGIPKSEALMLVDYVYNRPLGDPEQETGGVMLTLAILSIAMEIDMQVEGDKELARVWGKIEQIRQKQASKPKGSPLPGSYPKPFNSACSDIPANNVGDYRCPEPAPLTEDQIQAILSAKTEGESWKNAVSTGMFIGRPDRSFKSK